MPRAPRSTRSTPWRAGAALATLRDRPLDAAVLLGTGMSTLAALERAAGQGGPPVLSCMLALAWRTVLALRGRAPAAATLGPWLDSTACGGRDRARLRR